MKTQRIMEPRKISNGKLDVTNQDLISSGV